MIHLLFTGGTISMQRDAAAGGNIPAHGGEALVAQVPGLERVGPYRIENWAKLPACHLGIDRLWALRERVRAVAAAGEVRGIVITHGTDTMVDSAAAIAAAGIAKTIVLTGAMVPYAFGSSDGLFNLGSALSFAQVLPDGVYVAMNGQYFTWDRVRKNRETGVFEETR